MENIAQKKEEDQTRFFTEFGPHGNETQKKQTTEHYKSRFSNNQKKFFVCCYQSSKMICRTLGGAPIALLKPFKMNKKIRKL